MHLVFAHFGRTAPNYLIKNLVRTSQLFPDFKTLVLTDQAKNFKYLKDVRLVELNLNSHWEKIRSTTSHPVNFRNGFWISSLLRLIAVGEYAKSQNSAILHIESDVILSQDFPFQKFIESKSHLAFPVISSDRAIGSTIYVGTKVGAELLISSTLKLSESNPRITDMSVLSHISQDNSGIVQKLPIGLSLITPESSSIPPEVFIEDASGISKFSGVFDGADIGQYLLGDDPRNHRGVSLLRRANPKNYLEIGKFKFSYSQDRNFLEITNQATGVNVPLFSLHIHNKRIQMFDQKKSERLLFKAVEDFYLGKSRKLHFRVLLNSIRMSLIRRLREIGRYGD